MFKETTEDKSNRFKKLTLEYINKYLDDIDFLVIRDKNDFTGEMEPVIEYNSINEEHALDKLIKEIEDFEFITPIVQTFLTSSLHYITITFDVNMTSKLNKVMIPDLDNFIDMTLFGKIEIFERRLINDTFQGLPEIENVQKIKDLILYIIDDDSLAYISYRKSRDDTDPVIHQFSWEHHSFHIEEYYDRCMTDEFMYGLHVVSYKHKDGTYNKLNFLEDKAVLKVYIVDEPIDDAARMYTMFPSSILSSFDRMLSNENNVTKVILDYKEEEDKDVM